MGLSGGDGLTRDKVAVQLAGTCSAVRLSGFGRFLVALMEWDGGEELGSPGPTDQRFYLCGRLTGDPGAL